jgi:NosR/NirI family transcriptional regulator, nitrous oxide reductase regulator
MKRNPGLVFSNWLCKLRLQSSVLFKVLGFFAASIFFLEPFQIKAEAADDLVSFLSDVSVEEVFPGGFRLGSVEGTPPSAQVLDGDGKPLGFVILNTDFVPTIGYSGKPIHILIALDEVGVIAGAKLVKHAEPIVLAGIPIRKIDNFIAGYSGLKAETLAEASGDAALPVDIVSGATVTVIVIDDSIKRSAIAFSRARGLGGLRLPQIETGPLRLIDRQVSDASDWQTFFGEGAVRRLNLKIEDVNRAFVEAGNVEAIKRPEDGDPKETFIDLHVALVSQPSIGLTLLGEGEYKNAQDRLEPGQQAILLMANGRYSFRGSGFVRGGIFDRFQVIQGDRRWLFRDKAYKRLSRVASEDAPDFSEVGLLYFPANDEFDPTKPWRVQLLIQRAIGPLEKVFVTRDLSYQLPARFIREEARPVRAVQVNGGVATKANAAPALWMRVWQGRKLDIVILTLAVGVLTAGFFSQAWILRHPKLLVRSRIVFLSFTVLWIGLYANAQLSIVNVFTFTNSLLAGFSWEYFLMDPMLFILWCAVAAALIFWGRGAYCGWLCPFGAMQELTSMVAKRFKVPQIEVPWHLHELLWPIKYMIFLGLFGLSLYSLPMAERWAEIEPFKTAVVLKFVREWPYVLYALTVLSLGLFVERFYCRYLCPLGAALAIPGRLRINDWLKRYRECGSPCHRCANECMVQAIHPEGHINVNECLYCLHCQALYRDDQNCPVVMKKRIRQEKLMASPINLEGLAQ